MIKTISTLLMLTTLLFACKKVEEEPDPVVLVSHGSFEMEGTFTTDGWITNNTSSDPNTPVNGVSGAAPITRFDASKFKTQFACEVKNFDIGAFIDRKEARKMDPFCHYAVVTSNEAMSARVAGSQG